MMVESSVEPTSAGLVEGNSYPELPSVEDVLGVLGEEYGFMVSGASFKPFFKWVERRREVMIPKRSYRYVVELHIVLPHLNVHIIDTRSRWVIIDSPDEVREFERLDFMPWAPYPGNVKDIAFGRWLRSE